MTLYNRPANEFVAGFIGAPRINRVDRPAAGARAPQQALWDALAGGAASIVQRMGLRPEHLRVDGVTELLSAKVSAGQAPVDTGQVVGLQPDSTWALGFGADGRLVV